MKVSIEKTKVVGRVITEFGEYPLLNTQVTTSEGMAFVSIVDDEGFETSMTLSGNWLIVIDPLPVEREVKVILSKKEEATADKTKLFDDGTKEGEFFEVQPDDIIIDLR